MNVLYVGGPADGTMEHFDSLAFQVTVAVFNESAPVRFSSDASLDDAPIIDRAEYEYVGFPACVMPNGEEVRVFAPKGMRHEEVFALLFNNYRPIKKRL